MIRQLSGSLSTSLVRYCHRFQTTNISLAPAALSNSKFSTSQTPDLQSEPAKVSTSVTPKLIVFGGRGFVGSAICQEALKTGLQVVSISPAGTPPPVKDSWTHSVEWVRGDALEPRSYQHHLEGACAVVSTIGLIALNQQQMLKVNGTANVVAIEAAAAAGVPRFAFISAHVPNVPGLDFLMGGYISGKKLAEEALLRSFPSSGVALRPSFIYGSRPVTASLSLPLHWLGLPIKMAQAYVPQQGKQLASLPLVGAPFIPVVSVQAVAKAAVAAATDPSTPPGIMDVWEIAKYD